MAATPARLAGPSLRTRGTAREAVSALGGAGHLSLHPRTGDRRSVPCPRRARPEAADDDGGHRARRLRLHGVPQHRLPGELGDRGRRGAARHLADRGDGNAGPRVRARQPGELPRAWRPLLPADPAGHLRGGRPVGGAVRDGPEARADRGIPRDRDALPAGAAADGAALAGGARHFVRHRRRQGDLRRYRDERAEPGARPRARSFSSPTRPRCRAMQSGLRPTRRPMR